MFGKKSFEIVPECDTDDRVAGGQTEHRIQLQKIPDRYHAKVCEIQRVNVLKRVNV